MPAQAYNPLFIYGPPGVGKTHLLNAIANLLLLHNPGLTVRATNGEAFTNEFLAALADGKADGFKRRFRHIDVLLMDDVQFLERKTKTEEEFFHTFNALHDGGRQIVLTSDRPPARSERARGPTAGALPGGPRGRHNASRVPDAYGHPAQARPQRRDRRRG